jgi:uncharacterized protein (DUF1499 family)
MEEIRWWTRLLLVSAIISVVLLVAGPLGYKFQLAGLGPSFISLILAVVGAAIVVLVSIVMIIVTARRGLPANRNLLAIALLVAVVPVVVMVPQILKGRSVPAIHDITTDTSNPPGFEAVIALRGEESNPIDYGAGPGSPEELARLQAGAYPDLKPLATDLSSGDAVARAEEVLRDMGLEIVNVDAEAGIIEAVATTFWFGFKDDLVVRITPRNEGSVVDVRSVSRVGRSDLGANAARIARFLHVFEGSR